MRPVVTVLSILAVLAAAFSLFAYQREDGLPPGASIPSDPPEIEAKLRAYRASLYFTGDLPIQDTGEKVVYGKDDRKDIAFLDPNNALEALAARVARSTCLLTSRGRLTRRTDGSYDLALLPYRFEMREPCTGERFAEQEVGGWCSGFLAGEDLVATAGHCCDPTDTDARRTAFVFGFYATKEGRSPDRLVAEQVYFGKAVVRHQLDVGGDFALIRLDRKVTFPGATPLIIKDAEPTKDAAVGMVGYPRGLPAKISYGEQSKIYQITKSWLRTNLDSYAGNSGSVVTDRGGRVEGVLVRGHNDYGVNVRAGKPDCFFSLRLKDSDAGEIVTRASVFARAVKEANRAPASR
jgi:V8-like Glu-specific endopeptidase